MSCFLTGPKWAFLVLISSLPDSRSDSGSSTTHTHPPKFLESSPLSLAGSLALSLSLSRSLYLFLLFLSFSLSLSLYFFFLFSLISSCYLSLSLSLYLALWLSISVHLYTSYYKCPGSWCIPIFRTSPDVVDGSWHRLYEVKGFHKTE